jgi:hypothetical protein
MKMNMKMREIVRVARKLMMLTIKKEMKKQSLSSNESKRESRYILDIGAHVVKSAHVLETTVDTSTWKKLPSVQGITGDKLRSKQVGKIANIEGTAFVTPKASGDLLSVMEIIKPFDGRFLGDSKTMTILDGQDNVILRAYNRGDDY